MKSNGYVNNYEYNKFGLIFKWIDDYIKISNIDNWLHFLYKPNSEFEIHKNYCIMPTIVNNTEFRNRNRNRNSL